MAKKKALHTKNLNDKSNNEAKHVTSDNSQSYNEVSFDVLESAVEKHNASKGYSNKDFNNRAIISSDEMLPQKKKFNLFKKRDKDLNSKIGKLAIIVVMIILLFGVLAGVINNLLEQGFFNAPKENTPLKVAISEIATYDKTIIKLNAFLQTSITEDQIKAANIDKQDFEDAKEGLNSIAQRIDEISVDLDVSSEDYMYVGYAKQTIESRCMMIDSGLRIYDNACKSVEIIDETQDFWNNIVEADSLLKESDNLIQSNETENYSLAKQNSEEAKNLLTSSKDQVKDLNSKTSAFDFNTYTKYIDLRIESADLSSQACQSLIDQNIDQVTSLNKAYIEKSNAASEVALNLSTTPVQVIRTDYDLKTRPLVDEFKAARKNAADCDFALRTFLYT